MTALHSDLNLEVGPDHHFLVVPAISEYLSLIAKGGPWACRGPTECSSLSFGCSHDAHHCLSRSLGSLAFLTGITAFILAPCVLLTIATFPARCRIFLCRR